MRHPPQTLAVLAALFTACAAPENPPPPPVGGPATQAPASYDPPPPAMDDEPTCDDFLECALGCEVDFGADPELARGVCLSRCGAPKAVPAEILEPWGRACAALDGDPDVCDQGYDFCLHLVDQDA